MRPKPSFPWQSSPDLLASPHPSTNKTYVFKRPTCAHKPTGLHRLHRAKLRCSHPLPDACIDKASNPWALAGGSWGNSESPRGGGGRSGPLAAQAFPLSPGPCLQSRLIPESPKNPLEPAIPAPILSQRLISQMSSWPGTLSQVSASCCSCIFI